MSTANLYLGLELTISEADRQAFDRLPSGPSDHFVYVTDLETGFHYCVRRADCGLGCYCIAELAPYPQGRKRKRLRCV